MEPVQDIGQKTYLEAGMGYATVLQMLPLSTLLHQEQKLPFFHPHAS